MTRDPVLRSILLKTAREPSIGKPQEASKSVCLVCNVMYEAKL